MEPVLANDGIDAAVTTSMRDGELVLVADHYSTSTSESALAKKIAAVSGIYLGGSHPSGIPRQADGGDVTDAQR